MLRMDSMATTVQRTGPQVGNLGLEPRSREEVPVDEPSGLAQGTGPAGAPLYQASTVGLGSARGSTSPPG